MNNNNNNNNINNNNNNPCFIYMKPNPQMYVFQAQHDHLGSFHSLMFCLKLAKELLFLIFAGSCCHKCGPLYGI